MLRQLYLPGQAKLFVAADLTQATSAFCFDFIIIKVLRGK
jgi:hypothetical protein